MRVTVLGTSTANTTGEGYETHILVALFCRRLLILFSCRCGIEESKDTASAVPLGMSPLDVFRSESVAADLLAQVRWCNGVTCPRCRSDLMVKNGSYGHFQSYLCKNCTRTFNNKTVVLT